MHHPSRKGVFVVGGVFVALVLLVVVAGGPVGASQSPPPQATGTGGTVTSTVTFNGVDVSSHTSPGSAIATSFSGLFSTVFNWSSGGSSVFITQGVVSLLFFGSAIGTTSQQVAERGSGNVTLKSDFTQNQYLFEGNYEIRATLQSNGTTLFEKDFYIWVQATNHLTVVNVALILIALLEVYQIAVLGSVSRARQQLGMPAKGQPPAKPPGGT